MKGRDDIQKSLGELKQWTKDHERHDDTRFSTIATKLDNLPTKGDIEEIVGGQIKQMFLDGLTTSQKVIVAVAATGIALAVIGGGFKWLIGLLGFTRL